MPPKKKKLAGIIKLQIQAGQANPARQWVRRSVSTE